MERLYFFFDMEYEEVRHPPDLPLRLLLVSVAYVGLHWHPETEVLFVLKGSVKVRDPDGLRTISQGDVMVIHGNQMHGLVEETDNVILVLQYDERELTVGDRIGSSGSFIPDSQNELIRIRSILGRMALEKWDGRPGYRQFCLALLYEFLGILKRSGASKPDRHLPANGGPINQIRMKRVLEHLHERYSDRMTLAEVANLIGVSPNYASHIIHRETGRTLQENLNFIRTGHAVDLLLNSDKSILEISMETGFSDPKYFNQYFRRLFGLTPKQMKRRPDWRHAILSHFGNEGLEPAYGRDALEGYIRDYGQISDSHREKST
jgi:xylan 1,4-beta-xylosidase